ncbi:MAG TPA: hypothetical protein VII92_13405 [Anaerolineae bacterium]
MKTGIRQWFTFWYADNIAQITNAEIQNSAAKEQLVKFIDAGDPEFEPTGLTAGIVFENTHFITDQSADRVRQLHDKLDKLMPFRTWPQGHKLVIGGDFPFHDVHQPALTIIPHPPSVCRRQLDQIHRLRTIHLVGCGYSAAKRVRRSATSCGHSIPRPEHGRRSTSMAGRWRAVIMRLRGIRSASD